MTLNTKTDVVMVTMVSCILYGYMEKDGWEWGIRICQNNFIATEYLKKNVFYLIVLERTVIEKRETIAVLELQITHDLTSPHRGSIKQETFKLLFQLH